MHTKAAISSTALSMAAGSYSGAAIGESTAVNTSASAASTDIATTVAGAGYMAYRVVEKHHQEVAEAATESESDSVSTETENEQVVTDETDAGQEETVDVSILAGYYRYTSGAGVRDASDHS